MHSRLKRLDFRRSTLFVSHFPISLNMFRAQWSIWRINSIFSWWDRNNIRWKSISSCSTSFRVRVHGELMSLFVFLTRYCADFDLHLRVCDLWWKKISDNGLNAYSLLFIYKFQSELEKYIWLSSQNHQLSDANLNNTLWTFFNPSFIFNPVKMLAPDISILRYLDIHPAVVGDSIDNLARFIAAFHVSWARSKHISNWDTEMPS
jgi:hypothetical protein